MLVLRDVSCVVLIAIGSSTKRALSMSLTLLTSSLLVLQPMRFGPVVLLGPAQYSNICTRLPRHMKIM